jgi:cellulose biosynthesis protein BcsQ
MAARDRRGQIFSIFTHKGGVGKTTLLANMLMTSTFKQRNLEVLLIDLDPQSNLTQCFSSMAFVSALQLDTRFMTFEDFISKKIKPIYEPKYIKTDAKLKLMLGKSISADLESIFYAELRSPTKENTLKLMGRIQKFTEMYDFIIFDLNPSFSAINQLVLQTSDHILSPMTADAFSQHAVYSLISLLDEAIAPRLEEARDPKYDGIPIKIPHITLIPNMIKFSRSSFSIPHQVFMKKVYRMTREQSIKWKKGDSRIQCSYRGFLVFLKERVSEKQSLRYHPPNQINAELISFQEHVQEIVHKIINNNEDDLRASDESFLWEPVDVNYKSRLKNIFYIIKCNAFYKYGVCQSAKERIQTNTSNHHKEFTLICAYAGTNAIARTMEAVLAEYFPLYCVNDIPISESIPLDASEFTELIPKLMDREIIEKMLVDDSVNRSDDFYDEVKEKELKKRKLDKQS